MRKTRCNTAEEDKEKRRGKREYMYLSYASGINTTNKPVTSGQCAVKAVGKGADLVFVVCS